MIALVAHEKAVSVGGANCTTVAKDTTGATLLVVAIADFESGSTVLQDSKSNIWLPLTRRAAVGSGAVQLYYCANPIVGSGHTFTAVASVSFPALFFAAFSGVHTSPFDQEAGNVRAVADGSFTNIDNAVLLPSQVNCLVVTGLGGGGTSIQIDESFIPHDTADLSGGNNFAGGLASIIQTTAINTSPTWSWTGASSGMAAASASFKVAAAAQVATPAISPNGGSFVVATAVTLTCATSGADIYYTLDGSTPDATKTLYTVPFTLSADATVKAIGIKAGSTDSAVASAVFTITIPAAAGGGNTGLIGLPDLTSIT